MGVELVQALPFVLSLSKHERRLVCTVPEFCYAPETIEGIDELPLTNLQERSQ